MPNAEGRAATRGRAKATPATAPAETTETAEEKTRVVRSPIERATAALEKAEAALAKANAKLADFETTKKALEVDVEDAQVERDYAFMHPALVKQRKEQGVAETPARDDDYTEAGIDADAAADEPAFDDGSSIKTTVPVNPEDVDSDDAAVLVESGAPEPEDDNAPAPSFDFASALAQNKDPFAAAATPQGGNVTRV